MKKQIAILGSTGSIGTQALQVIEEQSDQYEAYVLTANNPRRSAYQSICRNGCYLPDCGRLGN